MRDALIIDAVRSPIGKRNGTLASVRADELAAQVLSALVARHDIDPGAVEDIQMGCVSQVGEQALNVGRVASLIAGCPETVCASTIDRQCGSSMQGALNGASAIQAGHLDLVVAAGIENMSRVPMGSNLGEAGFSGFSEKLFEQWQIVPQGISAEVIAEEWGLSRESLDEYSYESHMRAVRAIDQGRFENEIVPIEVNNPHTGSSSGSTRPLAARRRSRRWRRCRRRSRRTGSSPPETRARSCDGSAAMLIASEERANALGLEPRARFVSFGLAGVDPYRMLHGNPQACERALAQAGLSWDDMAVIEVNEAFASVVLQFVKDCGLGERMEDINPNGGGISLGHPLGATGARITATLLNELERRDARYGIATMCIGQGQAIAAVIERI